MKKISDIKSAIPHNTRLKMITKSNNIEEKMRLVKGTKFKDIEYSVEAFNDYDIFRDPDKIGITVFYPDKDNATHTLCAIYPFNIGMKEVGIEIKNLYERLLDKIPDVQKTKNMKEK
jgi:hypothetical protein